jgi:DNA-binding GntR family transcriptional regulator
VTCIIYLRGKKGNKNIFKGLSTRKRKKKKLKATESSQKQKHRSQIDKGAPCLVSEKHKANNETVPFQTHLLDKS